MSSGSAIATVGSSRAKVGEGGEGFGAQGRRGSKGNAVGKGKAVGAQKEGGDGNGKA